LEELPVQALGLGDELTGLEPHEFLDITGIHAGIILDLHWRRH
jgi:hypothetical protein